jgi:hypothetical protein
MRHNTVFSTDGRATTVISDGNGNVSTITESHPNYVRILTALDAGEDPGTWLNADLSGVIDDDRVSVDGNTVTFEGEDVSVLSAVIDRYRRDGRDTTNIVRFMERLLRNPMQHSREQLFLWTQARNLTIDAEGFIIGYKGVTSRHDDTDFTDDDGAPLFPLEQYPYRSSNSGHGIVDGIDINGSLPMGVGCVIEMPRDEVQHNPSVGCSVGLHVGTYDYAVDYSRSGALFQVRFDPADVVSVPSDCGWAKLRCCRYAVVAVHDKERDDLTEFEPEATWDEAEAMDAFMEDLPEGFFTRLKNRVLNRGKN